MNIERSLLEKFRQLPAEKQQEVLDFTEFIQQKLATKTPLRNIKGLWADLDINITEEDIKEMRQEMWGNFPREDF